MSREKTDLQLYYRPTCPYCIKVLNHLKSIGKSISLKNIEDEKNRQTLVAVGGKQQVPCLFIDSEPLYESLEIIEWIDEHKSEL